jgi:hypothetical protein
MKVEIIMLNKINSKRKILHVFTHAESRPKNIVRHDCKRGQFGGEN